MCARQPGCGLKYGRPRKDAVHSCAIVSPDQEEVMFVHVRIRGFWKTAPNMSRVRRRQAPTARRAMLSRVAQAAPRSRHCTSLATRPCSRSYATPRTIEHANASVNALVHIAPPAAGTSSGVVSNYAIAVKDNICTADMPTTCSSAILADFTSPFDATVVRLLRDNGATLVGKTNCDEFGMG